MMYNDDEMIMQESTMVEKDTAYPKYIKNRFLVLDVKEMPDGMCAMVADKEMGFTDKYYEGDELADGKVDSIDKEGVVTYKPHMAAVTPFALPSEAEMSPMQGQKMSRKRMKKDDEMKEMHSPKGAVLVIQVDDDMDRRAIY